MENYRWNEDKNNWLKQERGVSFEDVVEAIGNGQILGVTETSNQEKYPNQSVIVVRIRDYIYCVPYVQDGSITFLKTIFPSRKMKKRFLGDQENE
jgi:uncharacterized DUF497 family protein